MLRRHFFLVGAIVILGLMVVAGGWKLTLSKKEGPGSPGGSAMAAQKGGGGGGGQDRQRQQGIEGDLPGHWLRRSRMVGRCTWSAL